MFDLGEFTRTTAAMVRANDLARLVADYSSEAPEPLAA